MPDVGTMPSTTRSCGHLAPAVCQDPDCPDWAEAYHLDICCACQAARRTQRQTAWQLEQARLERRREIRRQLRQVDEARHTISAIRREIAHRTGGH